MVQILPATQRKQSFGERLSQGVGRGLEMGSQMMQQNQQKDALKQLGIDPAVLNLPKEGQAEYFKNAFAKEKGMTPLQEAQTNLANAKTKQAEGQQQLFEQFTGGAKRPNYGQELASGGHPQEQSQTPEISNIPDEQLQAIAGFAGQPGQQGVIGNIAEAELKKREKNQTKKEKLSQERRKEVAPIKKDIVDRAQSARLGIENKQHLLDIIEKGDINDPTYAALAESLPLNLGKRLLSSDTVEYKAGLIEEFGDLKRLFPGQIRVKEIEILQEKLADLYLDDTQKKQILNSRINALKSDIIREEVASDMEEEGKDLGILQYRKELEKRAKPKLDALFNSILDEQKAIIQNAENRKAIPLDSSDPEDMQIAEQIMKEAGGDRQKARQLAKKKGYTF